MNKYDDDPQCVCGVFLSEHRMMGCAEGFQTPEQWQEQRARIISNECRYCGYDHDPEYPCIDPDEDDEEDNDDFPLYLEYDEGLFDHLSFDVEYGEYA